MTRGRRRWSVGLLGTLALTVVGLLFANPTMLTAALVPLTYVLYGTLSGIDADVDLTAEREITPVAAGPGEWVTVRLTVENTGERTLPDVRVVDGVPEALAVVDGSPRLALPLSPGETATLEYTLVAIRGDFEFDAPLARVRSVSGSATETTDVTVSGDERFTVASAVRGSPFRTATAPRAGTLPMDAGGSGLEFFATRNYRTGDPMTRVDWHHFAKTGEFVTIEYREERAPRTVIVVDARPVARVTAGPGHPSGTALAAYAAERVYEALDAAGVVTSVTAIGLADDGLGNLVGPDGLPWIDPTVESRKGVHPAAIFRAIHRVASEGATPVSTEPPGETAWQGPENSNRDTRSANVARPDGHGGIRSSQPASPEGDETIRRLLARLPPNAQILLCTPVLDNWPVSFARALDRRGYSMVVVAPDVLTGGTFGQRLARIHRQARMDCLERRTRTVDWNPQRPVEYALQMSLPHFLTYR